MGVSRAMSQSSPPFQTPLEENYSKFPDSFQVSAERALMTNPISHKESHSRISPLGSNSGTVGHLFSSSSGFPSGIHFPSVSPQGRNSRNFPFISRSFSSNPGVQSTPLINSPKEINGGSWNTESLEDFLGFRESSTLQNSEIGSSASIMASEDNAKRDDWQHLTEQLIAFDDVLDSNWNEFLIDANVLDPNPKVLEQSSNISVHQTQIYPLPPVPSGKIYPVSSPLSALPTTKSRMRWTQELHDAFMEAVNQLGGSERATPKGILNIMKVEGLTIYHVKSHLQKYRTARYKSDSTEDIEESSTKKVTSIDEITTLDLKTSMGITEALRLQVEVQKRLHEQLEIQRNLQLQIEEQGRHLQLIFKNQRIGNERFNASSLAPDESSPQLPDSTKPSLANVEQEVSDQGQVGTETNTNKAGKEPEKLHQDPCETGDDTPPAKRARADDTTASASKLPS